MPNVYLRVPHYVASYFRNKNRSHRIEVGGVITIDPSDPIYDAMIDKATCNSTSVNRAYCFSARQWKRMMAGYTLSSMGTKAKPVISELEDQLTLSDNEVATLSGLLPPRNSDKGEYLCLSLPREVYKDEVLCTVNDHWQLTFHGACAVRKMMTDEFWRALYTYIDTRREFLTRNRNRKFVAMEALESFFERYDIRNSTTDQHELMTIKRSMNRKREAYKFTEEDYIEHG